MAAVEPIDTDCALCAAAAVRVLRVAGARAVCLVGSRARGDARPDSDLDLLVISDTSVRQMTDSLPDELRSAGVSLICRTQTQLAEMAREGSLFLLHARTEGRVLHDPEAVLAAAFELARDVPLNVRGEVERHALGLRHFDDLERFGDRYLFALADLYGIGKGVAVAWCAALNQPTFVKSDALAAIVKARPELRNDVAVVQRLRPFYDMTRGHHDQVLPFDPVGARREVQRALYAVDRLVAAAP